METSFGASILPWKRVSVQMFENKIMFCRGANTEADVPFSDILSVSSTVKGSVPVSLTAVLLALAAIIVPAGSFKVPLSCTALILCVLSFHSDFALKTKEKEVKYFVPLWSTRTAGRLSEELKQRVQ